MKFFCKRKDGGADSTVTGYWLVEIKSLFSIVLLKFEGESRNAYHTHAFNCINWVLSGSLFETKLTTLGKVYKFYVPSIKPFIIRKSDFHKVDSGSVTWVLSFRGPWDKTWKEYLPEEKRYRTLKSGRIEVEDGL